MPKASHGGKREGAGRPRTGIVHVTQAISMPQSLQARVRRAAAAKGLGVSEWVRKAIETRLKRDGS